MESKFTPSVIEPSFGIARILYSLLEHSFYQRDGDEQRVVFGFRPNVAPIKCVILPISSNSQLCSIVNRIRDELTDGGIYSKSDTSGVSIGRRYARYDEVGVPFAITVDFDTISDGNVTVRERDSTAQLRLSVAEAINLVSDMVCLKVSWDKASLQHGLLVRGEGDTPAMAVAAAAAAQGGDGGSLTKVEGTFGKAFSRPAEPIDLSSLQFP